MSDTVAGGEGAKGAPKILQLLDYIEQVERLKSKPAFTVPTDFFTAYQDDVFKLPELRVNEQVDGDDVWLRVPRLSEIAPPDPDGVLGPWVKLSKNPEKLPELLSELSVAEDTIKLEDAPDIKGLFDWYVEMLWTPWAHVEKSRRKTVALYRDLFALHQAIASEGTETPLELVWGLGFATWKNAQYRAAAVKHPLIVQSCEVALNEETFDLEVRPREVEPKLEIDCYAEMGLSPGVQALEGFWKSMQESGISRVNPFEPTSYEAVLKSAVGHLDPTGQYDERTDDFSVAAPADRLAITNTWVIFGRRRSADIFIEDIRRLKKEVEGSSQLPPVINSLVEMGDMTVRARPEQPYRGLSSSNGGADAMELYFPMPYNDEQVSIIQKLHANDGVVVQGPPGTGKTHTIANVICHFLAQGKRVLVTAKGESALSVLQQKLPEEIRPLSVSLLSDERDGMKQFEHAIQSIATKVSELLPARSEANITAAEDRLGELHTKIAQVDQLITDHAKEHMGQLSYQGRMMMPEEVARTVQTEAAQHEWFDDEPEIDFHELPVDDQAISAARRSRMVIAHDLRYLGFKLPQKEEIVQWPELVRVHRDLIREKAIERSVTDGAVLSLVDSSVGTFEKARTLVAFLRNRAAVKARLAAESGSWVQKAEARMRDLVVGDPLVSTLVAVARDVRKLENERKALLAKAVQIPASAELNADVKEALERLVAGKNAFALPFGKGDARKILAGISVAGITPQTREGWDDVRSAIAWRLEARTVVARWNALAVELGFIEVSPDTMESAVRTMAETQSVLEDQRKLVFDFDAKLHDEIGIVFGPEKADRLWSDGEAHVSAIQASLEAHLDRGRLAYAMGQVQQILDRLAPCKGAVVEGLRQFLTQDLGQATKPEDELMARWDSLRSELGRLNALDPAFAELEEVARALEKAGTPKWASRLRTISATADFDAMLPSNWADAWQWRRAVMFLDRIDGHHRIRDLFAKRRLLTTTLARTYSDLVAERTWLGVFRNSPDAVRQALQAYLNAVQAMGSGRGIRAIRHRRTAREAMQRAYQAVPCWVLPQWRVSETIPPEIGLFDLVVVDEASQSDIWALPALLRGKKMLIVGDHKQVSPSAVGMEESRILDLVNRFLKDQPHGSEMTPDKSIYDLARVVFAGNSVMLKEHFRSVAAIIEFSKREFYQHELKPLRLPTALERLDPPLVDVFVKGGYRNGDVNEPEAKAIVDEIEAILADPQMNGRTIGVVTLMGTKQAARIHELVSKQIDPVDIVNRQIAVGPPPVFQGRERDIMLVSMVLAPGDNAAPRKADIEQRFNVALSRARDRMYLFRSVPEGGFSADSLNGRLIRHFKQPFQHEAQHVAALRDRCESGFEREVFDLLIDWGYRVEPQVKCGGYRIDMVVEGAEGRRLAIECDGDRYHGPGQWQDDMTRQRVLERAGWTFWRCFASTFVRRRAEVLADLKKMLDELGIAPLGSETVDASAWVSYKEVDPFQVNTVATEASV
jgi:very-short-patch-repair endonuclease